MCRVATVPGPDVALWPIPVPVGGPAQPPRAWTMVVMAVIWGALLTAKSGPL
jgi:hypothetical protein